MCRRADRAMSGGYEGRTLRLESAGGPRGDRAGACWGRGFPWWALWLIWPLAGLLKWAAPFYLGALAALRAPLGGLPAPAAAIAAALLIIAGAWLIRRG